MVRIFVQCSGSGWFYWKSAMCRISGFGAGETYAITEGEHPM